MRRKLSIVLALCLLLTAFAGCGKGESAPETTAAAVAETLPADPGDPGIYGFRGAHRHRSL